MNTQRIDGTILTKMLYGGAAMLSAHAAEINALNVFPVADGDTGTNMLRTMEGGLAELTEAEEHSIAKVASSFAKGALLGARGNSGVILSQIFAGIATGLCACEEADAKALAEAYRCGIEKSYASVQNPTEGTILTVFREATEYAGDQVKTEAPVEDFFLCHHEEAKRSLAHTKDLLPVLAEADVVDSGGAGYVYILEGMRRVLLGEQLTYEGETHEEPRIDLDSFTRDSVLSYGYCTECMLRLTTGKVDPDTFDIQRIVDDLTELGGESIVAYKQDDMVKVHVHTFMPGDVLSRMQAYGEFLTVKIENMNLGHSETVKREPKIRKPFAVIAVAAGEGMETLFMQMGADVVVHGGQTINPSTEELIKAFAQCDVRDILVLPNNKNVILAARQAAELYDKAAVHVVETKNMAQGYAALSVITPGIKDINALLTSAERAAEDVTDGEITRAVRDSTVDGRAIRCGDCMSFSAGKLVAVAHTPEEAVKSLLEALDTDLCEIITVFAGKGVSTEARAELAEYLQEQYGECDVVFYEGGQDVYEYWIALE